MSEKQLKWAGGSQRHSRGHLAGESLDSGPQFLYAKLFLAPTMWQSRQEALRAHAVTFTRCSRGGVTRESGRVGGVV